VLTQLIRHYVLYLEVPPQDWVKYLKLMILVYLRRDNLKIFSAGGAPVAMIAWRTITELGQDSWKDIEQYDAFGQDIFIDFACGPCEIFTPFIKELGARNVGWVRGKNGKIFITPGAKIHLIKQHPERRNRPGHIAVPGEYAGYPGSQANPSPDHIH